MKLPRQQLYAISMILISIPLIFGTIWIKYLKNFNPINQGYKECVVSNIIPINGTVYYCPNECFVKFSKFNALFKSLMVINPCLVMVRNETYVPNGCVKVYLAYGRINSTDQNIVIVVPTNYGKQVFECRVYNLGTNTTFGQYIAVPKGF